MTDQLASDGLPLTDTYTRLTEAGMKVVTLPAGRRRYVNVLPALLAQAEVAPGTPTLCVRDQSDLYGVFTAGHVEVMGPSETVHSPDRPLPCSGSGPTAGRAYNSTQAAIRCYVDQRFAVPEDRAERRKYLGHGLGALPHFGDVLPDGGPGLQVLWGDKSARDAISDWRSKHADDAVAPSA